MHLGPVMNARISLEKSSMNIHFHVVLCILIFYTLFYMACSVCAGFMRIEDFEWTLPFRHTMTPSLSSSQYLGITFFLSGLLFVPVVGSMVWDYSATVTFVHVIVCCAGCGLFLMIISGQTLAYFTCRSANRRHI